MKLTDNTPNIPSACNYDLAEGKHSEQKIKRLESLYAALSKCGQAIVQSKHEEELFQRICTIVVETGGMRMAWVGLADSATRMVRVAACYGSGIEYLDQIKISTDAGNPFGRGPTGTAIRKQHPVWCQDFQHDPSTSAWHESGLRYGWNAAAALPLLRGGVAVGALILYSDVLNAFDETIRNLLLEMSQNVSYALDNLAGNISRQRSEAALQAAHDRLESLTAAVPGVVYQFLNKGNGNWQFVYVSRGIEDLYEVTPEEALRDHNALTSCILPEDRGSHREAVELATRTLCIWEHEHRIRTRSGVVKWVKGKALPHRNSDGSVLWHGILLDITTRKEIEEGISRANAFTRAILDALPANICVLDREGRILAVNQQWRDFAAVNSLVMDDGALGANYFAVCASAQGDDGAVARQFAAGIRAVLNGDVVSYEQEYPCHSPSDQRWFIGRVTRLAGSEESCVVIHEDITTRKCAEALLINLNERLEQQVAERTSSLSLTNEQLIREMAERQRAEQVTREQQQRVQTMALELALAEERERDRIAGELHDQVGQRLILAKMKIDGLASRLADEQQSRAAEEIARLLAQSIEDTRSLTFQIRPPLLAAAGLEAAIQWLAEEMKVDYGLAIDVVTDRQPQPLSYEVRATLFQAVRELLLNVARHADATRAGVDMRREGGCLVLAVTDDGIGFDVAEAQTRNVRSGGFGLFNIRQKIEYLGGGIEIDSGLGLGTRAAITIPVATAAEAAEGD